MSRFTTTSSKAAAQPMIVGHEEWQNGYPLTLTVTTRRPGPMGGERARDLVITADNDFGLYATHPELGCSCTYKTQDPRLVAFLLCEENDETILEYHGAPKLI